MKLKTFYLSFFINLIFALSIFGEVKPCLNYMLAQDIKLSTPKQIYYSVEFAAPGFLTDIPLIFTAKYLNGSTFSTKVRIDANQHVLDGETGKELSLVLGKFAKGETIIFTLTDNEDLSATVTIVPNPIEITDKHGHKLAIRMISQDGNQFEMEATGFEPNEGLTICSKSESETLRHPVQASPEGIINAILSPAVLSIPSGKASIEIIGKTTDQLKLKYIWGAGAFK